MFARLSDITTSHKRSESRKQESVVPMINVVFLMLLYFMVAGNLRLEDVTVEPPESSATAEPPRDIPQLVIQTNGSLYYDGRAVDAEQLEATVGRAGAAMVIRLAADAETDAVLVAGVIEKLARLGYEEVILLSVKRRVVTGVGSE